VDDAVTARNAQLLAGLDFVGVDDDGVVAVYQELPGQHVLFGVAFEAKQGGDLGQGVTLADLVDTVESALGGIAAVDWLFFVVCGGKGGDGGFAGRDGAGQQPGARYEARGLDAEGLIRLVSAADQRGAGVGESDVGGRRDGSGLLGERLAALREAARLGMKLA
jgi:hypothetical protein